MDTTIDASLEAVKRTFSQANKSKLYRRLSSYHPPSRIPPIQAGHCVFIVGNDSFLEPVPDRLWSISKIPPHVRGEIDENEAYSYTYTPRLVSVGPLHYKKPGLEFMEAQKSRFLHRLLERCRGFILPDDLKTAMRELEEETREYYSEELSHIDSDSFVEMMLLDGCFVIELLRFGGLTCQGRLADDPIFATRWMPLNLGVDLLLLENQLPLFVLHKLFDLTTSPDDEYGCLVNLALRFFVNLSPGNNNAARTIESYHADDKSPHLLALFHNSFIPKSSGFHLHVQEEMSCCTHIVYAGKGWIQTAKILNLSGIRFKPKPGNILDIEFEKRDLNIPPLFIDQTRAVVLKNLVAYEQHDRRAMPYFTSLVVFFSNILCTTDDVRILMKSGIIRQGENDEEETLKFFNGIVKDLVFNMNRCYLHKLIEDVNCTSQSFYAKIRSSFMTIRDGINIIEIVLLIISLVQTYLVVKSY